MRIDDLQYFVGSWFAQAEDPGTGRTFTLRYQIEPTLDGSWLTGYAELPERGVKVRDFWGRDAFTGEIVRIIIDSQGTYGIAHAKGWEGDTLRFEGEARSKEGHSRARNHHSARRLGIQGGLGSEAGERLERLLDRASHSAATTLTVLHVVFQVAAG